VVSKLFDEAMYVLMGVGSDIFFPLYVYLIISQASEQVAVPPPLTLISSSYK
jgi:hypothetical protein